MKKVFALSVSLLACMLIGFACKKSSTTTTTTPPASTTSTPINTTVTNFTVDGTPVSNPTVSVNNSSSDYVVTGIDGSHLYPQVQLVFPGTSSPAANTYAIVNTGGSPGAGSCKLSVITASGTYPASSSNVTVATTTTNSVTSSSAYFSNVICTYSGITHTVTGNVKWP